ncbi:hypothetical protein ACIQ6V_17330 [Streptomyces sp. NPDC096198]|uniref:recombination directionality factor n=1 Tax=Streptomyces sp. NPDC096198 TaxID=3366080 RepID=UPI0037FF163A
MTQSTIVRVGRFHQGRISEGRPQALDAWRVTTDDADVAARVAHFLGGGPQTNEGGGNLAHEVLTSRDRVRVIMDGPDAVAARMLLRGGKGVIHECDGSQYLSPEEDKGQPCGCPPLLEDKRLAARDCRGPAPSIDLTFRIAAAPMLGEFHFVTGSWQLAAQLSDLTDALKRVDGPAVCDLTMELVVYTTKAGRGVCYRKPVVTVLGSPDTVAPEPPLASAPSEPRLQSRRPAEPAPAHQPVPKSACSVSVDIALLHRAAQILGTSDHQETVIAALSAVVAGQQQTAQLARLRDYVGRIADIAGQALQGEDSSLNRPVPTTEQ